MNRRHFNRFLTLTGLVTTLPTLSWTMNTQRPTRVGEQLLQRCGFRPIWQRARVGELRRLASRYLAPPAGLHLRSGSLHGRSGTTGYALPLYLENGDASCRFSYILYAYGRGMENIHIFDQYQIEALLNASQDLDKRGWISLADTLLPNDLHPSQARICYRTIAGKVELNTVFDQDGLRTTHMKIHAGNRLLLDSSLV